MNAKQHPIGPVRVFRAEDGRWIAGVCAGLAPGLRVRAAWVRAAFLATGLLGGLGIALYVACWLIIPVEGSMSAPENASGIVVLMQACAATVALAALALVGAVATVFGFGWIVLGVAALALVGALVGWQRLGPVWTLLPIAALTLPAAALATSSLRLTPQIGNSVSAPRSAAEIRTNVYSSGLDTMLIDLRHTRLPASGVVALRIRAGVRRTIVALPVEQCVRVAVHYDVNPFAAQLGALLSGRTSPLFSELVLFGRVVATASAGTATSTATRPGPVLSVNFSSQGGSLYIRDYPNTVDPESQPNWPGFAVFPEPRPDTHGLSIRLARAEVRSWRRRLAVELSDQRVVNARIPGPCAAPAALGDARVRQSTPAPQGRRAAARRTAKARRPDRIREGTLR